MKVAFVIIFMYLLTFGSTGFSNELVITVPVGKTWQYRKITEGIERLSTMGVVQETDKIVKLVERSGVTSHEYCFSKKDGSILSWKMRKAGMTLEASRNANNITLHIKENGENRTETKEIGEIPWIQSVEFGLQGFVKDRQKTTQEFWIIRPTDGSIEKLVAEKEDDEKIIIGDHEYNTIQVEVTVPGWRSMFWGVDYWFRKNDGFFIRYKGANGPPGTPETIIELAD
jgi:hypothetical protein